MGHADSLDIVRIQLEELEEFKQAIARLEGFKLVIAELEE